VGVDGKLVVWDQLNDRLLAPTPEQRRNRRDYDRRIAEEDLNHAAILLEGTAKVESEPQARVQLP
jgi:hypothetical protein